MVEWTRGIQLGTDAGADVGQSRSLVEEQRCEEWGLAMLRRLFEAPDKQVPACEDRSKGKVVLITRPRVKPMQDMARESAP